MKKFSLLIDESSNKDSLSILQSEITTYINKVKNQLSIDVQKVIYATKKYNLTSSDQIDEIRFASKSKLKDLVDKFNIPLDELVALWAMLKQIKKNIRLLPQYQTEAERKELECGRLSADDLTIDLTSQQGRNAAVLARVEQSDDDVGLLLLLHHAQPLARRAHHLLEAKPAPQVLAQPVGDGGREQADDGDARAATLQDGVGLEVGLVGLGVDDVGAQDGAVGGAHPFVVDPMARLHVVVANGLRVIAEVVDDLCRDVGAGRVHIVGIIVYGLALEDVAIVEQDDVLAMLAAQLVDVCGHTSQRPSLGLAVDEVVGEEATVHVAGLNELQVDGFLFRCHSVG